MAGSVNKVIIVGNCVRDPEVRNFQNGGKVANLRVATSEKWKDRNSGERKERSEYHTVTITAEGLIGIAEQYLRKGSKVYVEGQLQTRRWQDQSGQDRYSTEVVVKPYGGTLVLLDGKPNEGGTDRRDSYRDEGRGSGAPAGGLDDSDIPFAPCWWA